VSLTTAKSPVATGVETVKEVVRWFVSVTVRAAGVVPTVALPNLRLAGETVTGTEPVPVRLTVCGLLVALSATVRVPGSDPRMVGVNAMRIVQVAPAANVPPLEGHVPPVRA
jgi:hypothetical protein